MSPSLKSVPVGFFLTVMKNKQSLQDKKIHLQLFLQPDYMLAHRLHPFYFVNRDHTHLLYLVYVPTCQIIHSLPKTAQEPFVYITQIVYSRLGAICGQDNRKICAGTDSPSYFKPKGRRSGDLWPWPLYCRVSSISKTSPTLSSYSGSYYSGGGKWKPTVNIMCSENYLS